MKVVCDTMIWYEIAKGNIDVKKLKDIELVATGVNILELGSTENLIHQFDLVKEALTAMEMNHKSIIVNEPWDYLLSYHVNVDFEPKSAQELLPNLKAFEQIIDGRVDGEMDNNSNAKLLSDLIQKFNQPSISFTKRMNEALVSIRRKGAKQYGKRKTFVRALQKDNRTDNEVRLLILEIFAEILKTEALALESQVKWENFELFYSVWDMYFKEKVIVANAKFKYNDFYDLLNMSYVGKDDKYWTLEKNPWIRLMNSNEVTRKYIYEYVH